MSQYPYYVRKGRWGYRLGHATLEDASSRPLLIPSPNAHMGNHGRERRRKMRQSAGKSRIVSPGRASRRRPPALVEGRFRDQILPIPLAQPKGGPRSSIRHEYPRPETTLEKLSTLKPAFKANGTVTAGKLLRNQ